MTVKQWPCVFVVVDVFSFFIFVCSRYFSDNIIIIIITTRPADDDDDDVLQLLLSLLLPSNTITPARGGSRCIRNEPDVHTRVQRSLFHTPVAI